MEGRAGGRDEGLLKRFNTTSPIYNRANNKFYFWNAGLDFQNNNNCSSLYKISNRIHICVTYINNYSYHYFNLFILF